MMRFARTFTALMLGITAAPAYAGEEALVCFSYACKDTALVTFDDAGSKQIQAQFVDADTLMAEREAAARAMGFFDFFPGLQTPAWRDRGGNYADDKADGRMDCIDHSTNTATFLEILQQRGVLRFHSEGEPVKRGRFLASHRSARVVEPDAGAEFVLDTWFLDPGVLATIFTLEDGLDGAWPPGRSLWTNGR